MRVLVCGSRSYSRERFPDGQLGWEQGDPIMEALILRLDEMEDLTVIHGAARGADTLAGRYAYTAEPYPADWGKHGKRAGPIRNQQMLDEGKPDLVLAFVDKPLEMSRGTYDMVHRAKKAGIPAYVIERVG